MKFVRKPLSWHFEGSCIRVDSHKLDNGGYPRLTDRHGRWVRIARTILIRRHGIIPREIVSRHTCDNPWCINPHHLLIGTNADNARDRAVRGRNRDQSGDKGSSARLTKNQALLILLSEEKRCDLAKRFNVAPQTISAIKVGQTWQTLNKWRESM